jgi:hypothetical protein
MMKIIKVIVDELPESCNICPFSMPGYDNYFCLVRSALDENNYITMENMVHTRPDWCPLLEEKDLTKYALGRVR